MTLYSQAEIIDSEVPRWHGRIVCVVARPMHGDYMIIDWPQRPSYPSEVETLSPDEGEIFSTPWYAWSYACDEFRATPECRARILAKEREISG